MRKLISNLHKLSVFYISLITLCSCTSSATQLISSVTISQTVNNLQQRDNQPAITKDMIAKICLNMTLAEVEAILGSQGEIVEDSTDSKSQSYEWRNLDGAYFWAVFAEGKLIGKGNVGLSGITDKEINLSAPPTDNKCSF